MEVSDGIWAAIENLTKFNYLKIGRRILWMCGYDVLYTNLLHITIVQLMNFHYIK